MERVNRILANKEYQYYIESIRRQEENRVFCLHGLEHSLDVARIGYIRSLENGSDVKKDVIYAAALLHDIGRCEEYMTGVSHHEAGSRLAKPILEACGYTQEECKAVCGAIAQHKSPQTQTGRLAELLYVADKQSRNCFACQAREACYWAEEKKNRGISI